MKSAWHLFVVRILSKRKNARDIVFTKLRKAGIGVQVHYLPVYVHPYYRALGYTKGLCPNVEEFANTCISIPLFPTITHKQQAFVAKKLAAILEPISKITP